MGNKIIIDEEVFTRLINAFENVNDNCSKAKADLLKTVLENSTTVSAMSSGGFGTTHYKYTTNEHRKHKR